jgi:AbrB family looped-hinge helix DNA binding protein
MLATIDQGGRVVVPKDVRERLGLVPGTSVELTEVDGHLEVAPAVTPMRLEARDGALVLATDVAMPLMTTETVRAVIEATRR